MISMRPCDFPTKAAMVLWSGFTAQESAMKVTFSLQARSSGPGAQDAARVAKENYLQEQPGRVGRATCLIVPTELLKPFPLDALFNEVMNGVFQGSGGKLILQHQGNEEALPVIVLKRGMEKTTKSTLLPSSPKPPKHHFFDSFNSFVEHA
jgi:hypothetical protein